MNGLVHFLAFLATDNLIAIAGLESHYGIDLLAGLKRMESFRRSNHGGTSNTHGTKGPIPSTHKWVLMNRNLVIPIMIIGESDHGDMEVS